MVNELNLLEATNLVEPCGKTRAQLDQVGSARMLNLSSLTGDPGKCVWCEGDLPGQRRRWCSHACVLSAMSWCYPQTPGAKMQRLIYKQNFACAACGESYEELIRAMIMDKFNRLNRWKKDGDTPDLVSFHYLGYNTGDTWQTDHITPIFKGGKGICPDNIQILCVDCHKAKTVLERKL